MGLTEREQAFIAENTSAAMITLRKDGTPHVVRVGVGLVGGKLWSSGTASRVRTKHLRRDPRATLFVFDNKWSWLAIEAEVTILDGPEAAEFHLALFRALQKRPDDSPTLSWFGKEKTVEEFVEMMRAEGRIIYQFEVRRTYGLDF